MGICASWPDPDPHNAAKQSKSPDATENTDRTREDMDGIPRFERRSKKSSCDSRNDCDEAYSNVFVRESQCMQLSPRSTNELQARPVLDRYLEFTPEQLQRRTNIGLRVWNACKHKINKPPVLVQYQSCYPLHCFYVNRHSGLPMRVCGVSTHFQKTFVLHAFVMISCEHIQYLSDVDPCDILSVDKWNALQLMMIKLCPVPGYFCDPLAPLFKPIWV